MRQWECGSVCHCDPIRFFYFLLNPGACRGTYAARARQPTGSEGRTLHAAKHCPLRALNEACSKGQGADCGKTLYRGLTVPNYAPEKGKGHPPVMEAEAAAAMTCPGVPTHRKRLRPAERVETESANMQGPEAG